MKIGVLILCLLAAVMIAPAAMAQSVESGNQSSEANIIQENNTHYGLPPVDPIELASQTSGTLYIAIRTAGCLDRPSRQISIANMDGKSVLHKMVDPYGKMDIRLPIGKYFILLPRGAGSGIQSDLWQQENEDVTIAAGIRHDVSFIGMGVASCNGGQ